jgi:hypothetical protein
MKLAGLGKLFTMLYDDRMDIYRTAKEDNEDSTTDISYESFPVYTDIKCRLSFSSDDRSSDSEVDRNPVRFDPKLFCEADVDLLAGDYVVVRRYADNGSIMMTYEGRIAKPSRYSTHQEAFMRIDEGA